MWKNVARRVKRHACEEDEPAGGPLRARQPARQGGEERKWRAY